MVRLQTERDALAGAAVALAADTRLQEMEAELASQRRKVAEQERLLRVRGAGSRRVEQLCAEIAEMKAARVQLMRRLRAEADRFRQCRASAAQEVAALRRRGQQQQTALGRLQQQLGRQQAVLRRKMEEAAAAQHRVRALNEKQTAARMHRQGSTAVAAAEPAAPTGGAQKNREEVEAWLLGEVAAAAAARRLRAALDEQLELRRQLCIQVLARTILLPHLAVASA